MSKNLRALSARQVDDKTLLEALNEAAGAAGSPSDEQLRALADERLVSRAALLGASSFYDFLRSNNRGKRGYICRGTSCMLSGRTERARAELAQGLGEDEIGEAVCLGRCYSAGGYRRGDRTYDAEHGPGEDRDDVIPLHVEASHSVFCDDILDLERFYKSALSDPVRIAEELSRSKLRGRGGAGFPFADKLAFCAQSQGEQKYVVCNGDEGDPGAFSDRYLLEQQPQRVLAGMLAAGRVMAADTGFVYVRAEYPAALTCVKEAVSAFEKTAAFAQSGFRFRVIRGAGSYVCGEETALLNSIEGLRPEVRVRPPYPAREGLFGRPTLVSNVETFAAVPWILQHGGSAFAAIGTEESSGSKLICLDNGFNHPGVHEVDMGTPLKKIMNDYGGGFRRATKAVQIGGPLGAVVPIEKIGGLSLDFESFDQEGFRLGHAGMIAIPDEFPMIDFLRHLFSYMADESCGKCLPCRLGTEKGWRLLKAACAEKPVDAATFHDLLDALEVGSLCGLGAGLPLPVRNIMEYFPAELADYFGVGTGE